MSRPDPAGGEQAVTAERPAPLGDLIGKRWTTQFRIVRLIGCGGMGEVWAASSDDIPGQLAVKAISSEHAHHHEVAERFFGEARAASALDDPNVVKVFDTGRLDDGRPVLIMELVDGPSLQAMIEARGPLPIDTVGQLMMQAASALRAAHAKSIVHRDIKPSNLLVTSRWGRAAFLIVVDFGIAKLGDPQLAGKIRTRTKAFIGTPGFVAPEQALGRAIDSKADLYALGVVLYHALTGQLPYVGQSELETLNLQVSGAPFREPSALRRDTPPQWNALVRDCLQLDPERRPTATEFGRRIASGLPNGDALLRVLAPRIAVHQGPAGASSPTLSSDVPTALAQLSDAPAAPVAGTRAARLALVVAGAFAGSLLTLLAVRLAGPADPAVPRGEALVAQPAPDAGPGPGDAARLAVIAVDAAAPAPDAPAVADAAPVAAGASDAALRGAALRDPALRNPAPRNPAPLARPGKGRVVISVTPFADVFIDGRAVGTTPIDTVLSAGSHSVRLVNQPRGRDQTITITVDPQKPVFLEKSW